MTRKLCSLVISFFLVVMSGIAMPPLANAAEDVNNIAGVWETDFVFPASDLGVNAPDIVFRCELTFTEDHQVFTRWMPIELTAIKMYFHQMFVSAYYACGYGAGYNSLESIEQFCRESTGMSVSDYIYSFLDSYDMFTLFCPLPASGTYRVSETDHQIYLDVKLMEAVSNPEIGNPYLVEGNVMRLNAKSFGQESYTMDCSYVGSTNETIPPVTEEDINEGNLGNNDMPIL